MKFPGLEYEILILAPTANDGAAAAEVMSEYSIRSSVCKDMAELCDRINPSSGAILIAEEALTFENSDQLKDALSFQEPWSNIPIVLMTSDQEKIISAERILEILGMGGSLSILERPFKIITLISALRVALVSRQRQYEVRDLLRKQIESLKQRDEFLSIASHELKTPLTSLKIQVQLREKLFERNDVSVFEPEKVKSLVHMTGKQVNRLTRLVDDMLDITRIQNGKLSLNMDVVDFDVLVKEVIENFAEEYRNAGCDLSFRIPEALFLTGDRYRLEQVITNLLSNALKYGNGCPVEVVVTSTEKKIRLSVRDHGKGIAPENHERIFERFERAVSATSVGGLGLGLYITRQIVELHNGTIILKSTPGEGSDFVVELPRLRT